MHQPEQHRDHRVHVRVRRHLGDRRVLQQPGVGRVGDQRPDDDEVDEREDRLRLTPRARRPARRPAPAAIARTTPPKTICQAVETSGSAGMRRRGERNDPRAHDAAATSTSTTRRRSSRRRAAAPGSRSIATPREPDRDAGSVASARARGPRRRAGPRPTAGRRRRAAPPAPHGTSRSATVTSPLPPAGQQEPDDRARPPARRAGSAAERAARGEHAEHDDAGQDEARRRRRAAAGRLDHHADGEVGRAPDDVDDAERRPHPQARSGPAGEGRRASRGGAGGREGAQQARDRGAASRAGGRAPLRSFERVCRRATMPALGTNGSATTRPSSSEVAARSAPSTSATRTGRPGGARSRAQRGGAGRVGVGRRMAMRIDDAVSSWALGAVMLGHDVQLSQGRDMSANDI